MKAQHPRIVVHINDSFGHILSELIMTGKMDMALIYSADPMKGVTLQPLFREEMFLVSPPGLELPGEAGEPLPLSDLSGVPLLLPSKSHLLRRLIDEALSRARVTPEVAAEIESVPALSAAVLDGLGSTILPASVVDRDRKLRRCPGQTARAARHRGHRIPVHVRSSPALRASLGGPIGPACHGRKADA